MVGGAAVAVVAAGDAGGQAALFEGGQGPCGGGAADGCGEGEFLSRERFPARRVRAPSNRWADPRAWLLDGPRWEAMRADVLAGLSLTEDADGHLAQLTRGLDAAWRQIADRL